MAIKRIEISGYRSIENLRLDVKQIAAFIGQNGSGKSNILSAVNYFYKNLLEEWDEKGIFDSNNPFRNEVCIRITYDLQKLLKIVQHNRNITESSYEKFYQKIQGVSKRDEIVVEMKKRKGRRVEWNIPYNDRQIIAALFPVYFIDARKIVLTDWTNLWNLIGDLIKLRYEDSERIQKEVKSIVEKSDENTEKKLDQLYQILEEKEINVKPLTARQFGKIIAELSLGGQMFQYGERNLSEYSNGTNAYNYTDFLIRILELIRIYKLKEPIIILDEPEISLHHIMVDRLMESIFSSADKIQFFISTHSSRCVKDLLEKESREFDIYHVALREKYSQVKRVKTFGADEIRERVTVTEAYANSCFTRMVLNVEGMTEMEVLKNKYLREIFPALKEAEIVKGMSDEVINNLTAPSKRNYQTAGLAIVDMDKMLTKNKNKNRFKFHELKGYSVFKEAYHYGDRRQNTLYLKRRIISMCSKCNFFYQLPLFSCEDRNFKCLLQLISSYCSNYQIYVWENTIEGALITEQNLELFLEYVKKSGLKSCQQKSVFSQLHPKNQNGNLNYIRMVYSGKSDFLLTKKEVKEQNPNIYPQLYNTLGLVKKTGGWVSQWLEFYFLTMAEIPTESEERFRQFCKWLCKDGNKERLRRGMMENFRELYVLLEKIEMTLR